MPLTMRFLKAFARRRY